MNVATRGHPSWMRILFWIAIICLCNHLFVKAGFDDTVSNPDTANPVCPVTTTCPTICVSNLNDCPTPACPSGTTLCTDGHCRTSCQGFRWTMKNPCEHDCARLACPKTVDDVFEACLTQFADFYTAAEQCAEQAKAEMVRQEIAMGPTAVGFLMAWIVLVTVGLVVYCQYKRCATTTIRHDMEEGQFQAGYCHHFVGTIMYVWTVITIWAFQVVFLALSIVYYANQNTATEYQSMWYEDEERLLLDFEVVWLVGFFWCFFLKWPASLRAIFWHPCSLADATVVAVWTRSLNKNESVTSQYSAVSAVRSCLSTVGIMVNRFMAAVFGVDATSMDGTWTYCPVLTQEDDLTPGGTKYFVHNFRRYNLDQDTFVPSGWSLTTPEDHKTGLSPSDVQLRRKQCGPNTIPMGKPTLTKVMIEEFTQPYYTYQNFIMWSWVPLWYYYMACVQSSVIIVGGVMVALFRLRNETSLYKLTHVEGSVQVVRGGTTETISPADLVPGDIIMVEPGLAYCDCVLVTSAGVLVDESALTGEANPIAKTALEDPKNTNVGAMDAAMAKRHTIQAGCTVLESEHGHNFAVVTHTGSYTTKGELLRNIFSYQRHPFKFDVEVSVVLLILVVYGFIGFFFVFWNLSYSPVYGWFYGVYALSSIMPPLLPTVFTVSVGVSDKRLSDLRIACTNSEEILVAGKVRRAFFDKTGTYLLAVL